MINRSSNIDSSLEQKIVDHIRTISGKITWGIVIDWLEALSGDRYSEQGLRKRQNIADAYRLQKKIILKEKGRQQETLDVVKMSKKLIACEEEIRQLKKQNNDFFNKFTIWAHNAKKKGMSEEMLNEPIENHRT